MKKRLLFVGIVGFFLLLAACGDNSSSADPGERAYKNNCSQCHGGNLSGGLGPDLRQIGSKYDEDDIVVIIEQGIGDMPAGRATGEDVKLIAQWLANKN